MPRISQILIVLVPLVAALPIVVAFISKQYPLLFPGYLRGSHEADIDLSIPSLFAMADIHGDYPRALAALVHAGVVDEEGNWKAGNATFVQTGDVVDRGPDTQKLYKWTRQLTAQAAEQGGKVVKLWGNHEFMNAMHDWRYVDPGDLDSFPAPHEKTRLEAFSINGSIGSDWMKDYGVTYLDPVMKAHFMHAGLDYDHSRDFNESLGVQFMKKLLDGHRESRYWSMGERRFWGSSGPMWYRGYATLPEPDACAEAFQVMKELDAEFLVMGHTPSFEHAIIRCGGHVLLIDTGLSTAYGGRPVVLEMRKKKVGDVEVRLHYDDTGDRHIIEVLPLS
ncbi:hypothetical protein BP5796_09387 [Coleophoma crateriformis]|uniref:Calcineurin-like phosphoesterase domain-containing protein n=1 Tax=Coleophoma crateriformis TaxID=565419 RepID=A0A3D8QY82_9HELO|nr:hypothetical protein BP5796_09387 [Coleophoma crateriformis]